MILSFLFNKQNQILLNRIHDLERTIETLTGANQILSEQLQRSQVKEEQLLEKIFNFTGLNSQARTSSTKTTQPISLSKKVEWPRVKENLETKSREEYWKNKKAQTESEIDKLEKEILA